MTSRRLAIGSFAVLLLSVAGACRPATDAPSKIGAALPHELEHKPSTVTAAVWDDVRTFYATRLNEPAWVAERKSSKAMQALQVLRTAPAHGFATVDYDELRLTADLEALTADESDAPDRTERLAELDVRLTTALLTLGRDVALGRTSSASVDRRWEARRPAPDFAGTLVRAAEGDPGAWLDVVRPPHPEYAALQKVLVSLLGQLRDGEWAKVSGTFPPGKSGPSLLALRQRLRATGELTGTATAGALPVYDAETADAIRSFQDHHAIKATGVVDARTLSEMNVSLDKRIRQVEVNLERWRWMPADFGPRHLLVNIPAYLLMARENGKTVKDIRVVVGKSGHETPVFSGDMATVVFSPYWNVPDSIVEGETAPAAARDASYLARNDIEILRVSRSGATPVDPSSLDWDDPFEIRQLAFRQRPGAKNALGHVKFLFPNAFDVYLHDTPADALFARPGRAFSHGCVRVEEPETLAKYVLHDYPEWDEAHILAAMNAGVEKHVKLRGTIPVHMVYFTAWVDAEGGVHFYPDVYGYDAKQLRSARPSL